MRSLLLTLLVAAMYALHQDLWFWDTAHPIVFGVLPIGLAYHVAYSIAAAALMWLLVRVSWPTHLDSPEFIEPCR
jgi:hypothetical protein